MSPDPAPVGRRERNKQEKLDRITAAAGDLFDERGIDDVTTQEIADRADIGTGTLFLYARTKGELLLLVQNARYATALDRGIAAASAAPTALDAVMEILAPIAECNRSRVDNGRTYLREMTFGDPTQPRTGEALAIVGRTEDAVADVLRRRTDLDDDDAATLARIVSAIMLLTLGATPGASLSTDEAVAEIRRQVAALLPR